MSTTKPPPSEKSKYQVIKEGGWKNFQDFMLSHNLRMYNDDDVQYAKHLVDCYRELDEAADEQPAENNKPWEASNGAYHHDSNADPEYQRVEGNTREVVEYGEESEDGNGYYVEGPYSYFEWGLDEPEFEAYPVFSDDENEYGPEYGNDAGQDYYDYENDGYDDDEYGYDDGDDGDDGDYGNDGYEDWM